MTLYVLKDMKEKLNIPQEEADLIYEQYKSGYSYRKLERLYPYSFTFIQKLIKSRNFDKRINENYPVKDGYNNIAICKKTGKKIDDYQNQSGAITTHLTNTYTNLELPSNYKRKEKEYKTGLFWYDEYFDFDYAPIKQIKKCKYCDWTTEDIYNQSGAYEKHLLNIHNKKLNEYVEEYPEERSYFKKEIYKNLVTCKICGKELKMINYKHLQTHNISLYGYKMKYGLDTVSEESSRKLSRIAKNVNKNSTFKKTSKPENELKKYIESLGFKVSQGKRKKLNGLEIDIFIKETNIGIEFNGCKYHTENFGGKHRNYHLTKTRLCESQGIQLLHIFEDEWFLKKEIILSKLNYILNKEVITKIYARKTTIKKLDNSTIKNEFLNNHHIQGEDRSTVSYGAYYNDELVAIMCFNNKRQLNKAKDHNNKTFELTRYCTHNDYRVVGVASKLLKHFINNNDVDNIISFADRRWSISSNNLYITLGFKLTKVLQPDYTYHNSSIHRLKRFHKFGFGKSSIKKKYPEVYDETKTEWEMMQELGYDRIWDCGKLKYEYKVK